MKRKIIGVYVPVYTVVLAALALFCGAVHLTAVFSVRFADFFNGTVSAAVRRALATVTSPVPFSIGEWLLLLLIPGVICLVVYGLTVCIHDNQKFGHFVSFVFSVLALIYILFVLTFATGYRATTIGEKLGLEDEPVSAEELYDTTLIVIDELNRLAEEQTYGISGLSRMPVGFDGTIDALNEAYITFAAQYPELVPTFQSRPKMISLSRPMTYTHIAGVYSFFTGESNINVNYPDFVIPFTAAHEMAHQRGVARENEANFVAFLVSIASENSYVRYSGYLNLYEYLASALNRASGELYRKAAGTLDKRVRCELAAYSDFFEPYRETVVSKVSDVVNDTYLSAQGTPGSVSYGLVVDLAVSYYKTIADNRTAE